MNAGVHRGWQSAAEDTLVQRQLHRAAGAALTVTRPLVAAALRYRQRSDLGSVAGPLYDSSDNRKLLCISTSGHRAKLMSRDVP